MKKRAGTGMFGILFLGLVMVCVVFSGRSVRAEDDAADPPWQGPSAIDMRIRQETAQRENPFAILPHKQNYLLPVAYNTSPSGEYFDYSDDTIDNAEVKFQISFKVALWEDIYHDNGNLYFAYTNQSYWQAYNKHVSSPFRETNHEPECFLVVNADWGFGHLKYRGIWLGLSHQSNGRSGVQSRSWNRLYAQLIFEYKDVYFAIKPWYRLPEDRKTDADDTDGDDNPDIHDYMGYGEFRVVFKKGEQVLSVMLRNNLKSEGNRGAVEVGWSFPVLRKLKGYVQYFNGYGESLIDYNTSANRIGMGFLLTGWL